MDDIEEVNTNEIKADEVIRLLNVLCFIKEEKIKGLDAYLTFFATKINNEINEFIKLQDYRKEIEING